jgi:hypothetical protein
VTLLGNQTVLAMTMTSPMMVNKPLMEVDMMILMRMMNLILVKGRMPMEIINLPIILDDLILATRPSRTVSGVACIVLPCIILPTQR